MSSMSEMTPEAEANATAKSSAQSYLVLARRYRPGQLEQVIGQQHVTRTLQNAIQLNRVHHAYLFTGCRGVGKTTVARILAKALNCENGPTPSPCDQCPVCIEIRTGRAVNVFEIDGASHTGVDDMRELLESVRYVPSRGSHKVYIVDEVHMLSTSAFNALLKTLEEPPPHVVFIFATTEPHKIPATILSRCQRFDFKRVSATTLVNHLNNLCRLESVAVTREGLALIARAADGSVRDSLSLLDQVIAYHTAGGVPDSDPKDNPGDESNGAAITAQQVAIVLGVVDRKILFDFSEAVLSRDAQAALAVIDQLFENGYDLAQFSQALLGHLRDLTVVRTCDDPAPLVDATEIELTELRQQAEGPNAALLQQHFDHFARTGAEIARSEFPRLLLEMATIEMANAQPLLPLGDLLDRLQRMEARLELASSGNVGGLGDSSGATAATGSGQRSISPVTASTRRAGQTSREPSQDRTNQPTTNQRGNRSASRGDGQGATSGTTEAQPPWAPAVEGSVSEKTLSNKTVAPKVISGEKPPVRSPSRKSSSNPAKQSKDVAGKVAGDATAQPVVPAQTRDLQGWQRLLEGAMGLEPVAAAAFAAGKLISWQGDAIVLGYSADSFELQWAKDPARRTAFEAACSQQAGRKLNVEIRELNAHEQASPAVMQASAYQDRERKRADRRRELDNEARGHPVAQMLVKSFGAQIEGIAIEADDS